jgi:tetratricopeptide (TPR) repeat protein
MGISYKLLLFAVVFGGLLSPMGLLAGDSGEIAGMLEEAVRLGKANQNEKAVEVFSRVIEEDPRHEKAHFYLVVLYWKLGKKSLAIQEYLIVKALNPSLAKKLRAMNPAIAPNETGDSVGEDRPEAVSTHSDQESSPSSPTQPSQEPLPETDSTAATSTETQPELPAKPKSDGEKGHQVKGNPDSQGEDDAKVNEDDLVSDLEDTAQYAASEEEREKAARSLLEKNSGSEVALVALKEVCAKKGTVSGLKEARDCIRKMIKLGYVSESDGDAEINELCGPQPE